MATWFDEHRLPSHAEKTACIRNIVLSASEVQTINAKKWRELHQQFPQASRDEFNIWSEWIWGQYLRQKMKALAKRKRPKDPTPQRSTPLVSPDQAVQPKAFLPFAPSPMENPVPDASSISLPKAHPPTPPLPSQTLSGPNMLASNTTPRKEQDFSMNTPRSISSIASNSSRDSKEDQRDPRPWKRRRYFLNFIGKSMRDGFVDPDDVIELALKVKRDMDAVSAREEEVSGFISNLSCLDFEQSS